MIRYGFPGADETRLPEGRYESLGATGELRVRLDSRLDLAALRGLRRLIAEAGDVSRITVDFAAVRWMDAAALRLLTSDLGELERAGILVVAHRLPHSLAHRLERHPLRRFAWSADDLFTDPDREGPGFVPSDR